MSKLRIKFGSAEIEYEGQTEFSAQEIEDIFHRLASTAPQEPISATGPLVGNGNSGGVPISTTLPKMHTNSIAAKLGGSDSSSLAIASAAHLQIFNGKEHFNRRELLSDMRSCPTRFKESMVGNMTRTMSALVKAGKFNQITSDAFSLSEQALKDIEAKLAS